jgi:shikimate dehydrogenase
MAFMSGITPDLYGLLGYPLGHTLSPRLHQAALRWAGLAGTYVALPVPPERLDGAMTGVRAWRLPGLNVTIPHKQAVMPFLDGLTPQAEQIGAVNTLFWEGDRLLGDNTDYTGFKESLPPLDWPHVIVTLLGAGGSARAVVAALRDQGVAVLHVVARRQAQAEALRRELAPALPGMVVGLDEAGPLEALLGRTRLLVNTTPVGMDGHSPLSAAQVAMLPANAYVYDLVYNPAETPLLAMARARGLQGCNGLEMLLGQAAAAFERWTGRKPPLDVLRDALVPPEGRTPCSAS